MVRVGGTAPCTITLARFRAHLARGGPGGGDPQPPRDPEIPLRPRAGGLPDGPAENHDLWTEGRPHHRLPAAGSSGRGGRQVRSSTGQFPAPTGGFHRSDLTLVRSADRTPDLFRRVRRPIADREAWRAGEQTPRLGLKCLPPTRRYQRTDRATGSTARTSSSGDLSVRLNATILLPELRRADCSRSSRAGLLPRRRLGQDRSQAWLRTDPDQRRRSCWRLLWRGRRGGAHAPTRVQIAVGGDERHHPVRRPQ